MTYVKKTWHDSPTEDTPISADNLNHIEGGIYDVSTAVDVIDSEISTLTSGQTTNANAIATETTARINAISTEASTRANADTTEATARSTAVTAEATARANADALLIPLSQKGVGSGVATLDGVGKVPSTQLPSYVDDVVEYANLASFPTTGETGKIYVTLDTNLTYRWSGSIYVEISKSLALGTTSSTAYAGDQGVANAAAIAAETTRATAAEGTKASDSTVVHNTGNENVDGTKTFTSSPIVPAVSALDNSAKTAPTSYVDAAVGVETTARTTAVSNETTARQNADALLIPLTQRGAANGVATLDSTSKVPAAQLPSYVDDVLEFTNLAAFPATGETGKIYVTLDTNLTYRWSGSIYVEISKSLALGTTSSTAYPGDQGVANATAISAETSRATAAEATKAAKDLSNTEAQTALQNYWAPTDNGDGTFSLPAGMVQDNGDGTFSINTNATTALYTKAGTDAAFAKEVNHGSTAGTTRPTTSLPVLWSGTVAPTNAVAADRWVNSSNGDEKIYLSGAWKNINKAFCDTRYLTRNNIYDLVVDGGLVLNNSSIDAGAVLTAASTALASAGGGTIVGPAGTYYFITTGTINTNLVSLRLAGAAITYFIPTAALAGLPCLDINNTGTVSIPVNINMATKYSGFSIIGSGSAGLNPTGIGMNYGDLVGGHLDDIRIDGFVGVGGIGLQFINRSMWTERTVLTNIELGSGHGNAINWAFNIGTANGGATTGTPSFGYTRCLDMKMNIQPTTQTTSLASVTTTVDSTSISVSSGGFPGFSVGMAIQATAGHGFDPGTTVQTIAGNTMTISRPAYASETVTIYGAATQSIGVYIGQNANVYNGVFRFIVNALGGLPASELPPVFMVNNSQSGVAGRGFTLNDLWLEGEINPSSLGGTVCYFYAAHWNSCFSASGRISFPAASFAEHIPTTHGSTFSFQGQCDSLNPITPSGDTLTAALRAYAAPNGGYLFASRRYQTGGNYNNFAADLTGNLFWGPATTAFDVGLKRSTAGVLMVNDAGSNPRSLSSTVVVPMVTKTTNYTLTNNDQLVVFNGASLTATLPDPTTAVVGRKYNAKNINSSALTVVSAGSSKTIDGAASVSLAQWAQGDYITDGTQWLSAGASGTPGSPGANGATWYTYTGTGAPSNGTGTNGDYILNLSTGDVFGPKSSGSWPGSAAGNLIPTAIQLNTQVGTTYTLVAADAGKIVESSSSSGTTFTIPNGIFPVNTILQFRAYGTGQLTIAWSAGVTVRTPSSYTTRTQYSTVTAHQRATNEWVLGGDLT